MNDTYKSIIEINQQCITDCKNCITEMAGKESHNDCPDCCVQCVNACDVLIKMMTAESAYVKQYALLCAEICDYCADHCEEHEHDHCKQCAKTCRACAEACRKIAA
ncbi:four-helix bundle copper-binding protein [Winogradskyella vidalii]|uniref:four-helix bundle copper-binding protein n=1 Tax=Winogradskyella vidalii TaxID=2615024 RepID=UPI0015C8B7DB|nr:four-helix bundle copper-binding protein [Winogradskyella vidalii]